MTYPEYGTDLDWQFRTLSRWHLLAASDVADIPGRTSFFPSCHVAHSPPWQVRTWVFCCVASEVSSKAGYRSGLASNNCMPSALLAHCHLFLVWMIARGRSHQPPIKRRRQETRRTSTPGFCDGDAAWHNTSPTRLRVCHKHPDDAPDSNRNPLQGPNPRFGIYASQKPWHC